MGWPSLTERGGLLSSLHSISSSGLISLVGMPSAVRWVRRNEFINCWKLAPRLTSSEIIFCPIFSENLGTIILRLVEEIFRGIVNISATSPCLKFDFGIGLAEAFGFTNGLGKRGTILSFTQRAPRFSDLGLDVSRLIDLGMSPPSWRSSLVEFSRESVR